MGHSVVIPALGQTVIEHTQDRKERLVPESEIPLLVSLRVSPVSHADDRVPDSSTENAFAAGHEKPHRRRLCVIPWHAVETVHVAPECRSLSQHLVPILIERAKQDHRDVQGYATIACEQRVHKSILLLGRPQAFPVHRQLEPSDVAIDLVFVHYFVLEASLVSLDGLCDNLDMSRESASSRGPAVHRVVPERPNGLFWDMPVHLRHIVTCRTSDDPVGARTVYVDTIEPLVLTEKQFVTLAEA
mmetsp:Transcript_109722/g.245029  ORF Transcript_109722/g.245029 Transcript_109722/m.245029 type:complete len:244 (-) Transcript_109722:15-746(-)